MKYIATWVNNKGGESSKTFTDQKQAELFAASKPCGSVIAFNPATGDYEF